jgi:D-alanine-D-alanine ligase
MTKIVALLVGGWSAEREVSLNKGLEVERALKTVGYEVKVIDVKRDLNDFIAQLNPRPDVVFNNLYGKGGEDGIIQGVLEMMQLPYTHSGVMSSAIGMNKEIAKNIASHHGVKVTETLDSPYLPPYVVKPIDQGSSVDVTIIHSHEDAQFTKITDDMIVERYVSGAELTCAVLDGKAQAVTEIISETDFFDYKAKYTEGQSRNIMPAKIPQDIYDLAMKNSEIIFNAIGANGLARCDYRYDKDNEGLVFMEINTQPGLTAESIGPSQLGHNGMPFSELCAHLVETASVKNK